MKILFLSFYFEPDLCAGSFRNSPLANQLSKRIGEDSEIHVVTTMPNRYQSFEASAKKNEQKKNITIDRIDLPKHQSGFFDQIVAFKTYFFGVLKLTRAIEYDLVYASSSRLFTAFLGSYVARQKGLPLYLDVRDIFRDTMKDVIKSRIIKFWLLPILSLIENYTFNHAKKINLVSAGFKKYFSKFDKPLYSYYTNGIDDIFLKEASNPGLSSNNKKVITYAGNIGEGQGLHKIIPQLASSLVNYRFIVIGDGGTRHLLEEEIEELNLSNVSLIDPVSRDKLIEYYNSSNFLFLHLNDYDAFHKVLPSKIFEYACFDQPMIAGVSGYAADFIKAHVDNHILFKPTNHDSLVAQLKEFEYKKVTRVKFKEKFSRANILKEMSLDILNI